MDSSSNKGQVSTDAESAPGFGDDSQAPSGRDSRHEKVAPRNIPDDLDGLKLINRRKLPSHCQVCASALGAHRPYYKRYRICPPCSTIDRIDKKDGKMKRFCQQCGRFQDITLFNGNMRTCRQRLERHAARRRRAHARLVSASTAAQQKSLESHHMMAFDQQPLNALLHDQVRLENAALPSMHIPLPEIAADPNNLQLPYVYDHDHNHDIRLAHGHMHGVRQQQQHDTLKNLLDSIMSPNSQTLIPVDPMGQRLDCSRPAGIPIRIHRPTPLRFQPPPLPSSSNHSSFVVDPLRARKKIESILSLLQTSSQEDRLTTTTIALDNEHMAPLKVVPNLAPNWSVGNSAAVTEPHSQHVLQFLIEKLTAATQFTASNIIPISGTQTQLPPPQLIVPALPPTIRLSSGSIPIEHAAGTVCTPSHHDQASMHLNEALLEMIKKRRVAGNNSNQLSD